MHYSNNYVNAFWDGTRMTYGDGQVSQGFLIMTALDVCGHEISHGLTSFTSQLGGSGTSEADALNEGNSDIFGTTIEVFARPNQHDWIMGADITCNSSGGTRWCWNKRYE
jgi:bacillolysin